VALVLLKEKWATQHLPQADAPTFNKLILMKRLEAVGEV
jgi:hypothetical protein